MNRACARLLAGLAVVLTTVAIGGAPAGADAAGPTDYRSEVTSVEPSADLGITFIGGDSFIVLDARGHDVVVTGYRGEPYLWFRADGTVVENERSPSRILNRDRYGRVDLPDDLDADPEPAWVQVADDGVYAWHDHRTHWMNSSPPPGAEPGEQVLEGVVPLVVDGTDVDVTVVSHLLAPPSASGWVLAGAAGLAVGALSWTLAWQRRWRAPTVGLGLVAAGAATGTGVVAFRSVPPETGPPPTLWLLPLVAVACGLAAVIVTWRARRGGATVGITIAAVVAGIGLQLLSWTWLRREALVRALIPSDLPATLDRVLLGGIGGIGVALVAGAAWELAGRATPRPSTTGA